jgi:predicted O-methyltransferase YrrM
MHVNEQNMLKWAIEHSISDPLVQANRYVEIGMKMAGTTRFMSDILNKHEISFKLFTIEKRAECKKYFKAQFRKEPRVRLLLMTSANAARVIARPLSLVFIDACHCHKCVTMDINNFGRLLEQRGLLVFHDTNKTPKRNQHNGRRRFQVFEAIRDSQLLQEQFAKINETVEHNGVQVWQCQK